MVPQRFDQPDLQPLASRFHNWYPTPLLEANPTTQDYAYSATVLGAYIPIYVLRQFRPNLSLKRPRTIFGRAPVVSAIRIGRI